MDKRTWFDRLDDLPPGRPFTTADAREVGLSHNALHRLTSGGILRRPIAGVYVGAAVEDTLMLRCAVLRLVVPDDCFVSDRSAAWLHAGDRALAPGEHLSIPSISCFRPSDGGRLRNGITASGERAVLPRDLMDVDGLRVTTPLRTALDLGRLQRTQDLKLHGMDTMLSLGRFSHEELVHEVSRFNRQRGVVELRVLAPLADPGSESFGETALRLRWVGAGLPRPETQISIRVDGREAYRIDLGLEELLLGAEYFGQQWHDDGTRAYDDERLEWLDRERGWLIEVFRKQHVFGIDQDAERRLRAAFDAARARRGLPRRFF
ncbi:type IV toxin-antitoxin system AbiEi family antitoxin domain-containing protein [Nocardioides mangrovi]|uniref:Type IV toxin-antitoxin system AbiEi family antitoxin domain-containing protein n=1 Tax=Nocardioides mangrovi TaxID=2874580 RepID=A0ABS7U7P9_9ACTN|nr:type IV toxin-antitoxin system AbiEi family antitoxin domain-containing protein [Nocardioides mangrovi]MBZ5737006.1 type IV toxin-antitoxin system AbiEi family antitoxin domain-containing protein [Nocardioides mangrovi]